MKNNRQSMILDIIAKEHIETQEQLLEQLRQRGVASTQATISRDIKQLHLVKEPRHLQIRGFQQPCPSEHCGQAAHHLP